MFLCLCALPWLVNPRSYGTESGLGYYPGSLPFGTINSRLIPGNHPFTQQTGGTHCGPDSGAVTGLVDLCTLSSSEKSGKKSFYGGDVKIKRDLNMRHVVSLGFFLFCLLSFLN